MKYINRAIRRAGRRDTTEHAISQVAITMMMVVAAAPLGVGVVGAILVGVAVLRGFSNV